MTLDNICTNPTCARKMRTWRALRQPLKSPCATPTSVDNALESALRPSISQTSLNRLTICISAGRVNRIWRAHWRSLDSEWAFWSLQIHMIGRKSGRLSFWSRFWPERPAVEDSPFVPCYHWKRHKPLSFGLSYVSWTRRCTNPLDYDIYMSSPRSSE
jgi:hypothetical protein